MANVSSRPRNKISPFLSIFFTFSTLFVLAQEPSARVRSFGPNLGGEVCTTCPGGVCIEKPSLFETFESQSIKGVKVAQSTSKPFVPSTSANLTANTSTVLPSGSLVIAMDNTLQGSGGIFNIRAYGLAVRLLHAGVPLIWIIDPSKSKDAADFSATATRIAPTAAASANRNFISGPLAVFPGYETQAQTVITAFNNLAGTKVNVYQLTQSATVPVYANLVHKPFAAALNNGGNADIHTNIYDAAGLVVNTHYKVEVAANLNSAVCYTFASEPHVSPGSISTTIVNNVRNFVNNGGNFLAQCEGVEAYANVSNGSLLATYSSKPGIGGSIIYQNFAEPFAQFQSTLDDEGGSVESFKFTTNPGLRVAYDSQDGLNYKAYVGRLSTAVTAGGGFVHYLAGHKYDGTGIGQVNGQRLLLNALLRTADRPGSCNLTIDMNPTAVNDAATGSLGQATAVNVTANDTDLAPGTIDPTRVSLIAPAGATGVTTDAAGDVTGFTVSGEGTWMVNATTGFVTFTPAAGYFGNPTVVSYTVRDNSAKISNQATITITYPTISISGTVVNDVNNSATILDGTETGTNAGGLFVYVVTSGNIIVGKATVASNGTYTVNASPSTVYTLRISTQNLTLGASSSTLTNQLPTGWITTGEGANNTDDGTVNGLISLTTGTTALANLNFGIQQTPTAVNDIVNGFFGQVITIPVTTNDTDVSPGTINPARVSLVAPGGATSIVTDAQGDITGFTVTGQGTWTVNTTSGAVTFTPVSGLATNPNVINYTVRDNGGALSNQASISINLSLTPILAVNDDFQATGINNVTGGSPGNVLTNDLLNNAPFTSDKVIITLISTGGVTGLTINSSGTVQVPSGSPVGIFVPRYRICEAANPTNCSEADVTIRVTSSTGGGNSSTPCNDYTPLAPSLYTNLSVSNSTGFLGGDDWNNKGRLIDSDITNSASWSAILLGSSWIEARDLNASGANAFPAGYYAGMVINDLDLVSLGASVRITTYLDNTEQESQTFSSLLSTLLDNGGRRRVGFITTKSFNRIRLTVNAGITVVFTINAFYAEVFKPCPGPEPVCNVTTALNRTTYAAVIEPSRTGLSGISIGTLANPDRVVNSDPNDFATISLNVGVLASGSISVRNLADTYPAGYFAGFDISSSTLLGLNLLGNVTIQTYLNGTLRQTVSSNNLLLDVPLLSGSSRQTIGFITNQSFNEIRLTLNQPVGVSLGSTQVYNAVVKRFCAGPALDCNTSTSVVSPIYPVVVNANRTGIDGLACVGCSIDNTERVINANSTDFASVVLVAGVGISGSVSIQDPLTDYAAGTFAGFDIENTSLVSADILNGLTIRTYLNGVLRETKSGLNDLISVSTSLLTDDGRRTVGFITTQSFDEVRITLSNTVSVNLGTTRIYKLVLKRFCEVILECNQTYFLKEPTAPVVVNSLRTGIDGVACVACSVQNANQVISASNSDFATITVAAGVLASGSVSVLDGITTYPQGSVAGFTIEDMNNLIQLDLFNSLSICTYNNGVLQECASGSQLIDLALLVNIIGQGPGRFNVGFRTTKAYDEIRISVNSLASVLNVIRVYSAYVDTRGVTAPGFNCCPTEAPVVSIQEIQNSCPSQTVNLMNLVTSTPPLNSTLVWFNGSNPATATLVANPTQLGLSGTYYAFYFNQTAPNNCYSPASSAVTVTIKACIVASDDVVGPVQTDVGGQNLVFVRLNDTVNGGAVDAATTSTTLIGTLPSGIVFNTSTGAVSVNVGVPAGVYMFDYQLCQISLPTNCDTATVTITVVPPPFVKLLPKVYLQGSLYGVTLPDTLMRDDLRVLNRLPLSHPYNYLSPVTSVGIVNASVFAVTGPNAIVDWVFVELRSSSDSTVVVDSRAALVQRDGDIVDIDGISAIQFSTATNAQSYFVAVRHRNHLGVMTATARAMNPAGLVVDFRKAATPTFRFSSSALNQAQVVVQQGRALWAGNAELDRLIIYQGTTNDVNPIYTRVITDPLNVFILPTFKARGYYVEDIDMNGEAVFQGTGNDLEFIYQNIISNHPGNGLVLPFFTIREQLP